MALLGGILTGILGNNDPATTIPVNNDGGILGLPTLPTLSIPLPSVPTFPTLSIPSLTLPTPPAPSSSDSVPPFSASLPPSSSLSDLSTSAASATSSSASTPAASTTAAPPPDLSTSAGVSTADDGEVTTVYTVFTVTSASGPDPSQSATPAVRATTKSFLQNKPLSGTIFGLIGLLVLVLIIGIATLAIRRRRRRHLMDDAVSFDPGLLAAAERGYDASEKGHSSAESVRIMGSGPGAGYPSSSSHYGSTHNAQQSYYSTYAPPSTYAAYAPPSTYAPPIRDTALPVPSYIIPRVPVPQPPLPAEFGSSQGPSDQRWKVANE